MTTESHVDVLCQGLAASAESLAELADLSVDLSIVLHQAVLADVLEPPRALALVVE